VQSTRYPGKVLQPFANGHCLLEYQLLRLQKAFPACPIVVATSTTAVDDPIVAIAKTVGVFSFRGDELDVLKRIVNCCQYFGFNRQMIRICSDNPFLQLDLLKQLIGEAMEKGEEYDYIGYSIDQMPAIRTHFGFFAESVNVNALQWVSEHVEEAVFHEHVTNYIYESTGSFNVRMLEIASLIPFLGSLRLTVDSREDLENAVYIYQQLNPHVGPAGPTWQEIVSFVENQPEAKRRMQQQMRKYHK
jgi:spore coat polysaccharide biosynthesis protein SpsF (cytidylyltransferase family)